MKSPDPVDVYNIREEWLTTLEEMTRRCREVPSVGGDSVSAAVLCRGGVPGVARGSSAAPLRGLEPGVVRGSTVETSKASTGVYFSAPEDLQKWVCKKRVDFLEVYSGTGNLTSAINRLGLKAAEGLDSKVVAYNRSWDLSDQGMISDSAWLVCVALRPRATHTGTPCTHQCLLGQKDPSAQDQC